MSTEVFANGAQTTLSAGIASGDTTLSVASAALFPTTGNFRLMIDSEILLVTAVSGTTFTVTRGVEGTTAASHASGANVVHIVTAAVLQAVPPTGSILDFAGYTAPTGWYLCDGSAESRTTDSALYDAITLQLAGTLTSGVATVTGISSTANLWAGMAIEGTGVQSGTTVLSVDSSTQITMSKTASASGTNTLRYFPWGNGDGSTTFNLPDLLGRVTIGAGSGSGLTNRRLGQRGGEETHQLTITEMPSHNHDVTRCTSGSGVGVVASVASSGTCATDSTSIANKGGDGSHNNMQPYGVVNRIIKR